MSFGGFAPLPLRLGGTKREGWSVQDHARTCADMAAIVPTMPLAVVTVDNSTGTPSIIAYNGQNGVGLANAPAIAATGGAKFKLTFSLRWIDGYEDSYPIFITRAIAAPQMSTVGVSIVDRTAPTEVEVATYGPGMIGANAIVTVVVW